MSTSSQLHCKLGALHSRSGAWWVANPGAGSNGANSGACVGLISAPRLVHAAPAAQLLTRQKAAARGFHNQRCDTCVSSAPVCLVLQTPRLSINARCSPPRLPAALHLQAEPCSKEASQPLQLHSEPDPLMSRVDLMPVRYRAADGTVVGVPVWIAVSATG